MKNKVNLYFFYPNILNPFCWAVIILLIFNFIFFSWWKREKNGKYFKYELKKEWFKKSFINVVLGIYSIIINTFWNNRELTLSYIAYLHELWSSSSRDADSIRNKYMWYLNNRIICFKNFKRYIHLLHFNKDLNGKWFIYLPEYPGLKEDLQMTDEMGGFLNSLCNVNEVYLKVSNKRFNKSFSLKYIESSPYEVSALYYVKRGNSAFKREKLWLCDVFKYILGEFPKNIHMKIMK